MAAIVNVNRLEGMASFEPPNHTLTIDHKLLHAGNGADNLAIWLGSVEPGGEAGTHQHPDMEQVFFVLDGQARFTLEGQEHLLEKGDLILVPREVTHHIMAVGDSPLKVLIIMAPPPDSDDQWEPVAP